MQLPRFKMSVEQLKVVDKLCQQPALFASTHSHIKLMNHYPYIY